MSDQTNNTFTNDFDLPSLPSINVAGQAWEYRAGRKLVEKVKAFQNLKIKGNTPTPEEFDQVMPAVKDLILSLFVRGEDFFTLLKDKFDDDLDRWYYIIGKITETIQNRRLEQMTADSKKFDRET